MPPTLQACRKWHWLTEKPHATGTLKNYCFPFCRPKTVLAEEFPQLPFKCAALPYPLPCERL